MSLTNDQLYYQNMAQQYAQQYNIPWQVFNSLITSESSYNPTAQNPDSSAYGLGQLTTGTAQQLGVDPTIPEQNLQGAADYFNQALQKTGGNIADAIILYKNGLNHDINANDYSNNASVILNAGGTLPPGSLLDSLVSSFKKIGNSGDNTDANSGQSNLDSFNFLDIFKKGGWAALLLALAILSIYMGFSSLR